jgi:hypothetical protein
LMLAGKRIAASGYGGNCSTAFVVSKADGCIRIRNE